MIYSIEEGEGLVLNISGEGGRGLEGREKFNVANEIIMLNNIYTDRVVHKIALQKVQCG